MAARQIVSLEQVLAKIQTTFGTLEAALTGTEFTEPSKATIAFNPAVTPVVLVGAGFSQNVSVVGPLDADLSLSFPFKTGGAQDKPGYWAMFLQSCGFKETPTSHVYAYTLSNATDDWKDLTVWGYTGNKNASGALLRKVSSVMSTAKITLDFEKSFATIDFTCKGAYEAASAAATQATVTKGTSLSQALKSATVSILADANLVPLSLEFDINNTVSVLVNPTAANGKGLSLIDNKGIKWSLKCYMDSGSTPDATLIAGTTAALSCSWGAAPNKLTVGTTKAMIDKISESNQNGVSTWDITGICVDNDFTVSADTTTPA